MNGEKIGLPLFENFGTLKSCFLGFRNLKMSSLMCQSPAFTLMHRTGKSRGNSLGIRLNPPSFTGDVEGMVLAITFVYADLCGHMTNVEVQSYIHILYLGDFMHAHVYYIYIYICTYHYRSMNAFMHVGVYVDIIVSGILHVNMFTTHLPAG